MSQSLCTTVKNISIQDDPSLSGEAEDNQMVVNMKKSEPLCHLKLSGAPSPTMFVVEDEDGIMKKIEFEEIPPMSASSSKLERQESEEILAVLKENAEQRQKKFAQLLNEHKEIVKEIGRIAASDCIATQAD